MPQKFCANCNKPLTPVELSLGNVQCTPCYEHWLKVSVPAAERQLQTLLAELHERDGKKTTSS